MINGVLGVGITAAGIGTAKLEKTAAKATIAGETVDEIRAGMSGMNSASAVSKAFDMILNKI